MLMNPMCAAPPLIERAGASARHHRDAQRGAGVHQPVEADTAGERQPRSRECLQVLFCDPVPEEHVRPGAVVALGHPRDSVESEPVGGRGPRAGPSAVGTRGVGEPGRLDAELPQPETEELGQAQRAGVGPASTSIR